MAKIHIFLPWGLTFFINMCIITIGATLILTKFSKKGKNMSTICNYFALGILLIVAVMFFRNRYFISKSSRYFRICLIFTFLTTVINTLHTQALSSLLLSAVNIKIFTTLDILLSLLTTSLLALYLISKVTEHALKEDSDFLRGKIVISSLYAVFTVVILLNLRYGYIFSVSASGEYTEGSVSFLPYVFLIPQALMVMVCCIVHKKTLSSNVKHSLLLTLPIILFCIAARFIYPNTSAFVLAITLIELTFFLNFQNRRISTNTLTSLNDGRSFYAEIAKRIKSAKKFKAYLIKLGNIGSIKENHGHRVGDEILYHFAFLLSKHEGGAPFHMYGTTFALVLPSPENDEESAAQTERLLALLDTTINYKGRDFTLEYTVAEHIWQDEANADAIYEKLEYAITLAKEEKKKHIVCSLDLEIARLRRKYLINRMHTISANAGFEVWFQPIYSNKKNSFSSMEVLLRLKEPNGTFISPAEFIPLAEKTGQIIPITRFVIDATCRTLAANPELGDMRASINLPMAQLIDPEFEENLNAIVDSYGLPHERISFEFTERVIIDNLELVEKNMRRLAESGYTFYLDDFGVGYSNFNCIFRLPLKTVKLDMSLTSTLENSQKGDLVHILTDFFHDMGLQVVAEGAETLEQVERLSSFGVDGIQGYYFAKPMPISKLKAFIKKQS